MTLKKEEYDDVAPPPSTDIFKTFLHTIKEFLNKNNNRPNNETKKQKRRPKTGSSGDSTFEKAPLKMAIYSYISYLVLTVVSWLKEFFLGIGPVTGNSCFTLKETNRQGYAALYSTFESFYARNVYRRVKDSFNMIISSVPGATVTYVEKKSDDGFWTWKMQKDEQKECINLASYNYLGFAENHGPCTDYAIVSCYKHGLANCSSYHEVGRKVIHNELEAVVAEFLGVEDAIVTGMGFATNVLNLPQLVCKGSLVISDECNHASLILGLRLSGATIKVFKHNNVDNLEKILRNAIITGHHRTRRQWKKILIVVEGVYSMEGSICPLPEIVALRKKYGAYIYLDEAHSVGAMGPRGRGVIDYFGLDPKKDIDILMGTFTKSFGSAGGYIAGSKELISYLRIRSQAACYAPSMSPPVASQIIMSMRCIMDTEKGGLQRVQILSRNVKYFRNRLKQMGFIIYGDDDSPVVPLLLFLVAKIPGFVRKSIERGLATVGVGFPATKITEERVRFCLSASHSKEILDKALDIIDEVGDELNLKYSSRHSDMRMEIPY